MISLDKVSINKRCRIFKLDIEGNMLRRLLDIGIIPGAIIKKVLVSPFGGISAYSIMGTTMAIRDKDVKGVFVEYE